MMAADTVTPGIKMSVMHLLCAYLLFPVPPPYPFTLLNRLLDQPVDAFTTVD